MAIMKTQKGLQEKLDELEMFCNAESNTIVEIQGEIQALKFALDKPNAKTNKILILFLGSISQYFASNFMRC